MLLVSLALVVIVGAEDVASLLQPVNRLVALANVETDDSVNESRPWLMDQIGKFKGRIGRGKPKHRENNKHLKRLAMIVSGYQDLALGATKFSRVVKPVLEAGWAVDIYLGLVKSGEQGADWFLPSPDFNSKLDFFNQSVAGAGARLAHFEIMDPPDVLIRTDKRRLTLYPPHNSSTGARTVGHYYKLELIAKEVLKREKREHMKYSFVLASKDDDHWMAPFNLTNFAMDSEYKRHVYSKDCAARHGVNDKTLLFGRHAFEAVLPNIYTEFWSDKPTLVTHNQETFTKAFLNSKGVTTIRVPFSHLPTLEAVYVRSNRTDTESELHLCERDRQPKFCLQGDLDFLEHLNKTVPSKLSEELNLCPANAK